ncbi:MAG: hypothetical protein DME90_11670 [Verrucomicrobia bacterium]|nr:MAG: hypothetical protein DME90_11670 [Verrucomicrobiota bacterium]
MPAVRAPGGTRPPGAFATAALPPDICAFQLRQGQGGRVGDTSGIAFRHGESLIGEADPRFA